MMTATAPTRPKQTDPGPLVPDFDTRLMLTGIGMDVLLARAGGQALEAAHTAVSEAVAAASRYGAEAATLAALTAVQSGQRRVTFRSGRILSLAADIIRDRGWHQGAWTSGHGAVCALRAVQLAAGDDFEAAAEATEVLLDRIRARFGNGPSSVPVWNDRRERTEADVLRLLG